MKTKVSFLFIAFLLFSNEIVTKPIVKTIENNFENTLLRYMSTKNIQNQLFHMLDLYMAQKAKAQRIRFI